MSSPQSSAATAPRPWRPSLKKNIVYSALGQGFLLILQVFSIKAVYTDLGHDAFGIIAFCQMISFLISTFLDKTTRFALIKQVAAANDRRDSLPFVRAFSALSTLVFVVLAALFLVGAPFVTHGWVELGSLDPELATLAIRILGVAAVTAVMKSFLSSILVGLQRHGYYNLIESLSQASLQSGLIAIIQTTGSFRLVMYWSLLHAVATLAVYAWSCARLMGGSCLNPFSSLAPLRETLGFKLNLLTGSMFSAIQKRFDTIILSKMLPIGELGFYAAIFNFTSKSNLPAVAIGQAAYPSFTSLASRGDMPSLQARYRMVSDVVAVTSLITFGFILFAGKPFLGFLFGEDIAHRLFPTFTMLLVGFLLSSLVSVAWIVSLASGRAEITTWSNFLSLAFIPLSFLLVSRFQLSGAGISWVIYNLTYCVFAIPKISRECLALPARHWFRHVGVLGLGASLTYGVALWWQMSTATTSWIQRAVLFAISTQVFAVYSYTVAVSPESRQALRALLRRLGFASRAG